MLPSPTYSSATTLSITMSDTFAGPVTLDTLAGLLQHVSGHLDALDAHLIALESKPLPSATAFTPSTAPPSQGGPAPKEARAPRKAKSVENMRVPNSLLFII